MLANNVLNDSYFWTVEMCSTNLALNQDTEVIGMRIF